MTTRRGCYGAQVIEKLVSLGLTSYEAKAYLALIRRDSFTAAQVARQSGLPRQRIYDVLGGLVEKGLAVDAAGNVVKYAATPPEVAHRAAARRPSRRAVDARSATPRRWSTT